MRTSKLAVKNNEVYQSGAQGHTTKKAVGAIEPQVSSWSRKAQDYLLSHRPNGITNRLYLCSMDRLERGACMRVYKDIRRCVSAKYDGVQVLSRPAYALDSLTLAAASTSPASCAHNSPAVFMPTCTCSCV